MSIVISSIVAPIIKDLILDYIRGKSKSTNNSEVRFNLVIDNEKGLIREINYQGASSELEKVLPQLVEKCLVPAENVIKQNSANITIGRNVTVDIDSASINDIEKDIF